GEADRCSAGFFFSLSSFSFPPPSLRLHHQPKQGICEFWPPSPPPPACSSDSSMHMENSSSSPHLFIAFFSLLVTGVLSKSTIEPCSGSESCPALLGYTLYADLKLSEVAALFNADPLAILAANAFDAAVPDVEDRILPAGLLLRIPTRCSCADGIRRSLAARYRTRPGDTLAYVASSVFGGLASPDQIREANSIPDPSALDVGRTLVIPLPCACFNLSDNFLPAIYLSYVVRPGDSVPSIAARYSTTATDVMNVNAVGGPAAISPGDVLVIPLPACASMLPNDASDFGLIVANGTYSITASQCVQCSCGPGNLKLYCTPASLSVSCSSMQCRGSNLTLGNITARSSSAGCSVTSCAYGGFVNGSIVTNLPFAG
ncbi:lysM domain-containing GPI-anchored protein, partial [Musa troglodytarum]